MTIRHTLHNLLKFSFLFLWLLAGCSPAVQSVDPGADLPEKPGIIIEQLKTPTPFPKGQAQFSISRSGTITAGIGGAIEVSGEFPIEIYFSEDGSVGPEILYSEGDGTATTTANGAGTVGTGEMIGVWDVKFKVLGIFKPAPDCSLELTIEEIWQPGVEVTLFVKGQEIIQAEGGDEFIILANDEYEFGNVLFPWGVGKVVENYLEPTVDWVNTYEVTALHVPAFTGCDFNVESAD